MQEEKLKKVCNDFSLLNEEQQNYILGIMQALVFAKNSNQPDPGKSNHISTPGSSPNLH
jgi:hypothetical protein